MKLRNKKTGKIINLDYWNLYAIGNEIGVENDMNEVYYYNSLAKFCKEWEDYDSAEPLIKDKKIRKAIRAWAEVNDLGIVQYCHDDMFDLSWFMSGETKIYFKESGESCLNREFYTIDELCGEEE